jgi:hypothetical protein
MGSGVQGKREALPIADGHVAVAGMRLIEEDLGVNEDAVD